MRLLERNNDGEFSLTKDFGDHVFRYAILSHTWGADTEEVTFRDLMDGTGKSKAGYGKIRFCGEQARRDGLYYFWVDTCCIDKSNNTELAEAINSMFRWYRESTKCYVYLSDVSITKPNTSTPLSEFTWESAFRASRWFTRGWTLQELLAPDSVELFSRAGKRLGDKKTLEQQIHEITGIAVLALQGAPLSQFRVDDRLLWAENRQTARKEDKAYSLLGIFNVYMPLIYGEGRDNVLIRLREEIDKSSRKLDRLPSPKQQHELYITEGTSYRPLKYSCPNFTGRADFISRLRDFFGPETTSRLRRRDFVLYGLGGCGKTQICLKFAEESTHMFWKIFWIDATSATTLDLSFREIALDPAATYDGVEDSIDSIVRWLSRQDKEWLVIFDNADEEPETVERFLAPSNRGNTLITSRNPNMRQLVHEGAFAQVEQMEEGEAISLLCMVAHITNPSDETLARLRLIVNELGFIPLAIRHAGVAIAHGFCNYRDYLEMFHQHPLRLLAHPSFKGASQYDLNLIATWETSLVAIQGNAVTEGGQVLNSALHIFRIFSFFHPNGIMDDIFRRAASFGDALPPDENFSPALGLPEARDHLPRHILPTHEQGGWDPIIFKEAIRMLLKHSFIQIDVSNGVYSVHPLVQYWARHRMTKEEQADAFRTATALLATAAGSRSTEENYTFRRQLIPHVHALYQFRVETGLPDQYYDDASNYFWTLYEENEYWKDAEKLGQTVMKKRLGVLGETHPSTVESMARLALTLRQLDSGKGLKNCSRRR
ncbi:HET-domain-containing protein [Mollisia scopiformis]|uniref:HET-domain-containing protein n=1 Tax=Mollisia scopiformis TaxID=149040 RepID=A0A194WTH5_MOLSC|nr:HET-domain-containing protein [Mollisia scopiformis]KUJ10917.1 HET-domain-containing protein [Mollisia scopiformis]